MRRLAQSTAYTVMLKMFLSSDHVSPATGKTVAIKISKNGGAFANPNAGATNATEVSDGWYKVALDTTDTGTLGDLVVRGTATSCDDSEQACQVVSATTGGATNLDAAVSAVKTKTDSLTFTVAGMVDSNVVDWKGATAPAMTGDAYARLGAPVGASISADIAGVQADTDNIQTRLPTSLVSGRIDASVGAMANDVVTAAAIAADAIGSSELAASAVTEIQSGLSTLDAADVRAAVGLASANLDTQLDALPTTAEVNAEVDTALSDAGVTSVRMAHLDADVSSRLASGSYTAPPSAATIAQAVWDALTSALTTVGSIGKLLVTNVDAAITSRLASGSYTAPDNSGITAIKAKTDNLPGDPADASDIAASFSTVNSTLATIAGYVDTEVAAIKAKTDQITFTVTGQVDANIQSVNDQAVTGSGTSGDPWGPA